MVELVFNQNGEITENTLYFEHDAAITEADMIQLAEFMKTWWDANLKANVHSGTSLTAIRVTDLTTQSAPGLEYTTGLPIAGTAGGVAAPNNVTVAISFRTNFRGRSYRGRNYFVGLTMSNVSGQQLAGGVATNFDNAYSDILVDLPVDLPEFTWVVVSRYTNKAPRAAGVTTPVTAVSVENTLDSQRRRLPGRGD